MNSCTIQFINKFATLTLLGIQVLLRTASAQPEFKVSDQWQFQLAPMYLWAVGMEGTMSQGPIDAPVDVGFDDALNDLDLAFTVHFEASKGRLTALVDYTYVKLKPNSTLPNGAGVDVDFKVNLVELGGTYMVAVSDRHRFDVLAGLRVFGMDVDASISSGPSLFSIDNTIVDGFVGGRYAAKLGERWAFTARADIGAGDSDLVWSVAPLFHYRFSNRFSGLFGYRWLDYDYSSGAGADRFALDARIEGPVAALNINW